MARRVVLVVVCLLAALFAAPVQPPGVAAREPATRSGHLLGKAATGATIEAAVPTGFQDQPV
ncbi:MAG TPA: hypothetical protein VE817_03815, partial [Candidatus Acidoferrum sp.]|nr:hypothetical protein [Candidatus Acidoferrum sp.]